MYEYKYLQVTFDETVCILTLNRPEVYNALREDMLVELNDFFKKAKDDENVRALVITGAGKGFCAGADVAEWDEINETGRESNWVEEGHNMILGLQSFPKPVIAAVNGAATGAGCDMTLACDFRFGSEKAKFGEAYINMGYCPDNGGSFLLPRVVGWSKAREMIYSGRIVKADEAKEIGILDFLVEHDNLVAEAVAYAKKFAEGPTVAIGQAKWLLNRSWFVDFEQELENESKAGAVCQATEDTKEAVKAFTEKRKPNFKGR